MFIVSAAPVMNMPTEEPNIDDTNCRNSRHQNPIKNPLTKIQKSMYRNDNTEWLYQILSKMSDLIEVAPETEKSFFTFDCPVSTCATAVAHRAAAGSGFEVSISCNFPTELCCSALPLASSTGTLKLSYTSQVL